MSKEEQIKPFVTEHQIQSIISRLGEEITNHYQNTQEELIVVGLLRGSFIFMADLVRKINHPMITDFMTVSSYGDQTESSGNVKIIMDLDQSIAGKHVLLVEDIVDTGNTFSKIIDLLRSRNPKSLKTCTLLNKPSRREVEVNIDFCGIDIPDKFVIGYGLDYAQKYRNLPYVGILSPES